MLCQKVVSAFFMTNYLQFQDNDTDDMAEIRELLAIQTLYILINV